MSKITFWGGVRLNAPFCFAPADMLCATETVAPIMFIAAFMETGSFNYSDVGRRDYYLNSDVMNMIVLAHGEEKHDGRLAGKIFIDN